MARWKRSCCSVAQSCLTLCDPTNGSVPAFPVLHYLPEFSQTHVHWVGDAIQPCHPLSPPSPPTPNPSQHQGLFQWVSIDHWGRLSYLSLLFFGTLHSNGYIFPFLLSSPWSWWCQPTISSSVIAFSFCPQSFRASGSFQMSQLFASGGQSIGV